MKRILLIALVAALTLPVAGIAQTAAQPAAGQAAVHTPTVKIGWMNVQQAIVSCDEGSRVYNEIQKYVDSKNNELDAMKREAEDLRTKLEVQSSKLTDEALVDLEERARLADVSLQRFQEDTQREIANRQNRMLTVISGKMGPVIEKVAVDKGFDAILIFDPQRDAWVNPGLNVTDDVVKAYNQLYPAGAPTMPAAAKKP